jgi:hypothetical protein
MKLEVKQDSLEIIPESEMEIGWIEHVLELRLDGDSIPLVRVNAVGLSCIAYLKVAPEEGD